MQLWTVRGLRRGVATTRQLDEGLRGVRGLPEPSGEDCEEACERCREVCPTNAISLDDGLELDQGVCIGCNLCVEICPTDALRYSATGALAVRERVDLRRRSPVKPGEAVPVSSPERRALRQSLFIRHVDAGSCNGCESEIAALDNPFYNLHRYGIFFTPSPRFADVLLVTGPVTSPMLEPLRATYAAMPDPKYVVATGVCAISGGISGGGYNAHHGLDGILPVDLWVPGCPPSPAVLLHSLLTLVGRDV